MTGSRKGWRRFVRIGALAAATVILAGAGGHIVMMMMTGPDRPPASEFGLGPRPSRGGLYTVTLEPDQPLKPRRMHTVRAIVQDGGSQPVDGATIRVDGGMPQHGHGLPTRPRVTKSPGGGVYVIEGVRFNMGGWWEFRLAITSATGADSVTFNLDL